MKRIFTFLLLFAVGFTFAQDKKDEIKVNFSGFIKYNAYYDTYKSVHTRDGDIYLYPLRENLDDDNNDLNANPEFNMLTAQSRVRVKASGASAFGAKINSLIELDFYGINGSLVRTPRIRHAFVNMNWGSTQLLFGQTWHPTFAVECFPQVISMGAALPFNPLNRAPQVRLTHKLSDEIVGLVSLSSHGDMRTPGDANAQKNAVLPDIHGQIKYVTDNFTIGATAGYKLLKPRLSYTDTLGNTHGTDKTIGSFDVAAFTKIKMSDLTVKLYGIYGQNLGAYTMIGGYGAASATNIDGNGADYDNDYDYVNINTMAIWGEIMYKIDNIGLGFFGGYSKNLGVKDDIYYRIGAARADNIDNILRISPRVTFTSGKMMFGVEYMMTSATYRDLAAGKFETAKNAAGKELIDDAVSNNRIMFTAKYSF